MNWSFIMLSDLDPLILARLGAITSDRTSGAMTLGRRAIRLLLDVSQETKTAVDTVAVALCLGQPAMAPVWNAAAVAVGSGGVDGLKILYGKADRAPQSLSRVFRELVMSSKLETDIAVPLVFATVSASNSVRICFEALSERATIRAICAEGRPRMEGRQLATTLAAAGITATICTDAAIGETIAASSPQVEAVVIGTDAVTPQWFLNKCGTRQLLELAVSLGVPTYVVASRDKFISEALAEHIHPNSGPSQEVWQDIPRGVYVENPYFEKIPIELVATFATDVGSIGPASVQDMCQSQVVSTGASRLASLLVDTVIPKNGEDSSS